MTKKNDLKNVGKYIHFLVSIGLEFDEAVVYECLIKKGPLIAHAISLDTSITRPLTYKVLDELEQKGLVTKKENSPSKVSLFEALSPNNLERFVYKKNLDFVEAKASYAELVPELNFLFTERHHFATIQHFEGIKGITYLFSDIVEQRKDLFLIRSFLDDASVDVHMKIRKQKELQKQAGMHVRIVSPREVTSELIEKDKNENIERRFIDPSVFSLASQISIYGDRVAIVSYKDPIRTTIIIDPAVNETLSSIFQLLWNVGKNPEDMLAKVKGTFAMIG